MEDRDSVAIDGWTHKVLFRARPAYQEVLNGVLAALFEYDTPPDLLARAAEVRPRTNGGGSAAG